MTRALYAILALVLGGPVGDALGEQRALGREPLEGKRRLAPIRGRRLGPARTHPRHDHDDAAEWKREDRHDRDERSGGRGRGGDKEDDDE
jgi:hypothetical protein